MRACVLCASLGCTMLAVRRPPPPPPPPSASRCSPPPPRMQPWQWRPPQQHHLYVLSGGLAQAQAGHRTCHPLPCLCLCAQRGGMDPRANGKVVESMVEARPTRTRPRTLPHVHADSFGSAGDHRRPHVSLALSAWLYSTRHVHKHMYNVRLDAITARPLEAEPEEKVAVCVEKLLRVLGRACSLIFVISGLFSHFISTDRHGPAVHVCRSSL